MLEVFFKGALIGLGMSIAFIGPSFFALIQTSIKNGFRSAVAMAAGISFSDIILVFLTYIGAVNFLDNPKNKIYEGFIGGGVLLTFGIVSFFQKHDDEKDARKSYEAVSNVKKWPLMLVKGFFLNILNPMVLLVWITWVTTVSHFTEAKDMIAMGIGTLGTIFSFDVLKALAANRIKRFITPKLLKWIHYIMAIALIVCGIILLIDVLTGHTPKG
jgi:threonine/homoserine/homoserine lactone efflux protein